ncbi:MAG: putative ABC transporter permease [Eubacterium sp.]
MYLCIGGNLYCTIELIYRARTHYSMFFCAGIAIMILLAVYVNNKNINPFIFALIAAVTITSLEFIFGVIFNIWLKMNVWDYSNVPMNLFGQICLPFTLIWLVFGIIIYYAFKLLKV